MKVLGVLADFGQGARLPSFLDGVKGRLFQGSVRVDLRVPADLSLPELLAANVDGTWDTEEGVLVAGRVPYLTDRRPDASTCLVLAARAAGLGLMEAALALDLVDRLIHDCAIDLRGWTVADPERIADAQGLGMAWRHCMAQLGVLEP